jgi:pentapeptide MXKDX repeat protein
MQTSIFRAVALGALLSVAALAGPAHAENPMVGGAAMFGDKDIIDNAVNSADHTTLVAAVQAAGLVETLKGEGPFTVFAPVNAAFDALPAGALDTLLEPGNKDQLSRIVSCHVVAGDALMAAALAMPGDAMGGDAMAMDAMATDAMAGDAMAGDAMAASEAREVTTVGGCKLWVASVDGMLTITDEGGGTANVTIADVVQSNGVIHVIDKLLLPAM